jgi:Protein of unknown function (DUF1116)
MPCPMGQRGRIVAVRGETLRRQEGEIALAAQARRIADGGGEPLEIVGHRRCIQPVGSGVSGGLPAAVAAINIGLQGFGDALREQGAEVVDVDWRPPGGGDPALVSLLARLWGEHGATVEAANAATVRRLEDARPLAVTVAPAREVIGVLRDRLLLHSGPAIAWERVCDPQRRALVAACVFEGWAPDAEAAASALARGEVQLAPGNEHGHVGPMTGVCSPSMPVWVAEEPQAGVRAFSTLNEGPGRTLWFGVGDDEAIARLRFFRDVLGPALGRVLEADGPIDVLDLAAQGVAMGDELHMRSQATGNLLLKRLLPGLTELGDRAVAEALSANHHLFLNLTMAAAKCASMAAAGERGASIVTLMARNGTDMGLQVGGLPGRWFTAPAARVADALLREPHTDADAALDIGDSAVIECVGLGGMAVAASPVVATFFGGHAADAVARTRSMGEICAARSQRFTIPSLDFAGTPVGIDARLVTELQIAPQITTGVLHASSGAGQIGAGVAHQPLEPFHAALEALAAALDEAPA